MIVVKEACGTSRDRLSELEKIRAGRRIRELENAARTERYWLPKVSGLMNGLKSSFVIEALYALYVDDDVESARSYLYLAELVQLRSYFEFIRGAFSVMTSPLTLGFRVPLSNAMHLRKPLSKMRAPLLRSGSANRFAYFESRVQQAAMIRDTAGLQSLVEQYDDHANNKSPNLRLRVDFFRALADGDSDKVQQSLEALLDPKEIKRSNYHNKQIVIGQFLGHPAMWFAKAAWINGFEIEIEHPLVASQLLDEKPLDDFSNPYGFLVDPEIQGCDLSFFGETDDQSQLDKERANQKFFQSLVMHHGALD